MTTEEIEKRISEILKMAHDAESAHAREDDLRKDFIRYIAMLDTELAQKAQLVLTTEEIDFPRWCA